MARGVLTWVWLAFTIRVVGARRLGSCLDAVYRSDSRRFLATLIRLLGNFDLAEEALHDCLHRGTGAMAAGRRARFDFDASLAELAEPLDADGAATDWAWIVGLYDVLARRSGARDRAEPRRGGGECATALWPAGLIDTPGARRLGITTWRTGRADLCRQLGRTIPRSCQGKLEMSGGWAR